MKLTNAPISADDGRDSLNLYFGAVSVGIKKGLIICGKKRQRRKRNRQIKSF
jgi:hypothetical protein